MASPSAYSLAISKIDIAHARDPTLTTSSIPYELHYAEEMTRYLTLHTPSASPILQIAIRAQHFLRWEVPRSSYPTGKLGYLKWRADQKKRAAEEVKSICLDVGISEAEAETVAQLVRKEGLGKNGDEDTEVQALEDVACLVFLDDQFAKFAAEGGSTGELGEDKMLGILRKTWGKMGERGRELALQIEMNDQCKALVGKALGG